MIRGTAYRSLALGIGWASALACSVFPDQAVLPVASAAGSGGVDVSRGGTGGMNTAGALAGRGGDSSLAGSMQAAGASGSPFTGGGGGLLTTSGAGGASAAGGSSGSGEVMGGEGGAAGGVGCTVIRSVLPAGADATLDSTQKTTNFGSDAQLFVVGGVNEQRAALAFTLPKLAATASLQRAVLVLTPVTATGASATTRAFEAHVLSEAFDEGRVTWTNWTNGAAHKWATPGGDFGAASGSGKLKPAASVLRVDVTSLVATALTNQVADFELIVLEISGVGAAPAPLSFASREAAASAAPALQLEYCPP